MTTQPQLQDIIQNKYKGLAIWHVSDRYAEYWMIGTCKSSVEKDFRRHMDQMGVKDSDYEVNIRICEPDEAVGLRYPDHELTLCLKAKEWAAIFDSTRPEWNILGCTEWN